MKFCKDCKRCELRHVDVLGDYSRCGHPALTAVALMSPVTGQMVTGIRPYCDSVRAERGKCGLDAKLFEPTATYAEHLRDQKIDAGQEARQDRAEGRSEFNVERDCGERDGIQNFY